MYEPLEQRLKNALIRRASRMRDAFIYRDVRTRRRTSVISVNQFMRKMNEKPVQKRLIIGQKTKKDIMDMLRKKYQEMKNVQG